MARILLKELIRSVDDLDSILEEFRTLTNWTDYYMSGGCYTFADALYQYIGKQGKFVSVGEVGTDTMVHVCILFKGKYCDYNGCRTKRDILGDITLDDKPEWKFVQRNDITGEHNYDTSDVKKIIKQLKSIG